METRTGLQPWAEAVETLWALWGGECRRLAGVLWGACGQASWPVPAGQSMSTPREREAIHRRFHIRAIGPGKTVRLVPARIIWAADYSAERAYPRPASFMTTETH